MKTNNTKKQLPPKLNNASVGTEDGLGQLFGDITSEAALSL